MWWSQQTRKHGNIHMVPNDLPMSSINHLQLENNMDIPYFPNRYLRRGDTKGSCVTGDAGDHSVRKPTCDRAHVHRTVGYVANGCRKIRIASRMMMMMVMVMMMLMMRMMTMMLMMRHCEGAAAWRDAQGMWREFTWGGGHGTGHSEQSGDIWIRKESTPRCPWLLIT